MSKLDVCRVCFSHNIRMHNIKDTRFQEIYEKHTGSTLITEDSRPDSVCYICNSQLQRFFKFLQMAETAEECLYRMHRDGIELTEENVSELSSALHGFSIYTAHHISVSGLDTPSDTEVTEVTSSDNNESPHKTIQDVAVKIESVDYEEALEIPIHEIDLSHLKLDLLQPELELSQPELDPSHDTPVWNLGSDIKLPTVSVALERLPIAIKQARSTATHYYSCKQCARRFRSVDNLNTHIKSVHRTRLSECSKCGKTFNKARDLRRHFLRIHAMQELHACSLCGKKFKYRTMFYVHVRTHTGEKPYSCKWCQKKFNDKSNCRKHMKTHCKRKEQHPCFLCDRIFTQKSRLIQHAVDHIL